MRFITAIYGDKYLPFLWAHLQSITYHHPKDFVTIFYNDIASYEIKLLKNYFSKFNFLKSDTWIFENEHMKRIPLKLLYWSEACIHYPNEFLCFIDCDTLIFSNISKFFNNHYDVIYTWKNQKFPLNTGVILLKSKKNTCLFMKKWLKYTEGILNDNRYFRKAIKTYGAADQHALQEIIQTNDYNKSIQREIQDEIVEFKGILCEFLNETDCKSITEDTHIVHYKGGWHKIILEDGYFTKNRPIEKCRNMFNHWIRVYQEAINKSLKPFVMESSIQCQDKFRKILNGYEECGILNSEMLLICSLINSLGIELIIESGRFKGQSTEILAKFFSGKGKIRIKSIELKKDKNAEYVENKLENYINTDLLYGDTQLIIPAILSKNSHKKIGLLFDGTKGENAIKIFKNMISKFPNILVGFFHDMRKSTEKMKNPSRRLMEDSFKRIFFSDDLDYVNNFRELDKSCLPINGKILKHTWRPYMKGDSKIGSYGPTVAAVLPLMRERLNYRKKGIIYYKEFFLNKLRFFLGKILGNEISFCINLFLKKINI